MLLRLRSPLEKLERKMVISLVRLRLGKIGLSEIGSEKIVVMQLKLFVV